MFPMFEMVGCFGSGSKVRFGVAPSALGPQLVEKTEQGDTLDLQDPQVPESFMQDITALKTTAEIRDSQLQLLMANHVSKDHVDEAIAEINDDGKKNRKSQDAKMKRLQNKIDTMTASIEEILNNTKEDRIKEDQAAIEARLTEKIQELKSDIESNRDIQNRLCERRVSESARKLQTEMATSITDVKQSMGLLADFWDRFNREEITPLKQTIKHLATKTTSATPQSLTELKKDIEALFTKAARATRYFENHERGLVAHDKQLQKHEKSLHTFQRENEDLRKRLGKAESLLKLRQQNPLPPTTMSPRENRDHSPPRGPRQQNHQQHQLRSPVSDVGDARLPSSPRDPRSHAQPPRGPTAEGNGNAQSPPPPYPGVPHGRQYNRHSPAFRPRYPGRGRD